MRRPLPTGGCGRGLLRVTLGPTVCLGAHLDWRWLDERIEAVSSEIEALAEKDAACQPLTTVPGIGPIISTATVAAINILTYSAKDDKKEGGTIMSHVTLISFLAEVCER
jgi:hypothetical protein